MATATLPASRDSRTQHPAGSHNVPCWVVAQTGVTEHTLRHWRDMGYLTRPGHDTAVGKGHRFDWTNAVPQIVWLDRLYRANKLLDYEDAAAGWRYRPTGVEYAIRVGGDPWQPVDCLSGAFHSFGVQAVIVAPVRP